MFRLNTQDDEFMMMGFDYGLGKSADSKPILEDVGGSSDVESTFGDQQTRQQAMTALLTWVNEGDFTADALDAYVVGIADMDGNDEIDPDEEMYYEDLYGAVADAMLMLGADPDDVDGFINDADDEKGKNIGETIVQRLESTQQTDADIIQGYAIGGSEFVLESTIKVVRGGKVVRIKKKFHRKRLTSAQRMALQKARRKAFTSAAMRKRAKSMKIRKKRGL